MEPLPQTAKISDFKNHPSATLERVASAPVVIMQRSEPRAVLVSVNEWDATAERIRILQERVAQLECMEAHRRDLAGDTSNGITTVSQDMLDHQMRMTLLGRQRLNEMMTDSTMIVSEDAYQQQLTDVGLAA